MKKQLKSYRFDENTIKLVEELRASLNLENNSAVLRKALTLLKVVNTAVENGGSLVLRGKDSEKEIIIC
jgi:hypothetical protein